MKLVPVVNDQHALHALVDDEDYELAASIAWCPLVTEHTAYAHAWHHGAHVYLHRLLLNAPADLQVDHINHNGLDNQRSNLRLATASQNQANKLPRLDADLTSKYKGVWFDHDRKRWASMITVEGRRTVLGRYDSEEMAAAAYDHAARAAWGEFAVLNNPEGYTWSPADREAANRKVLRLTAFGETKSAKEWAADPRCAVSYGALILRVSRRKWEHERAITTPTLPNHGGRHGEAA
jgi:hypothetical protein